MAVCQPFDCPLMTHASRCSQTGPTPWVTASGWPRDWWRPACACLQTGCYANPIFWVLIWSSRCTFAWAQGKRTAMRTPRKALRHGAAAMECLSRKCSIWVDPGNSLQMIYVDVENINFRTPKYTWNILFDQFATFMYDCNHIIKCLYRYIIKLIRIILPKHIIWFNQSINQSQYHNR